MDRKELVDRLRRLDAAVVSDVLDEVGFPNQIVAAELAPLDPAVKLAGIAVCASGEPRVSVADPVPGKSVEDIEAAMFDGAVAVLGTGGFTAGTCVGGFVATSLKRLGCVGLLTDGAVRDAREIRELGLPAFVRLVTPINGSRRWNWTAVGQPVALPGQTGPAVVVNPGDLIVGDCDGVAVIPAAVADEAVPMAERLVEIEHKIAAAMKAGATRAEAFKANPRFKHLRRLRG